VRPQKKEKYPASEKSGDHHERRGKRSAVFGRCFFKNSSARENKRINSSITCRTNKTHGKRGGLKRREGKQHNGWKEGEIS